MHGPRARVVLTFDDGYTNFQRLRTLAAAALRLFRDGIRGHATLPGKRLGRRSRPPRTQPMLSWQQLLSCVLPHRDRCAYPPSTHPHLSHLSAQQVETRSPGHAPILKIVLGAALSSFALSLRQPHADVMAVAARHFRAACTTTLKRASGEPRTSFLELTAYYIAQTHRGLERDVTGRLDRYLALRRVWPRHPRGARPAYCAHCACARNRIGDTDRTATLVTSRVRC